MRSVLEIITASSEFLAKRGVESPRLNAEHLIGHALGLSRMQLYVQFERPLVERELEAIRGLLRRRAAREPLQYIVGEVEFFGLTLKVDRRALIPRPETEYLVSLLTERLGVGGSSGGSESGPQRILDLGTGTGAIALALAKHWAGAEVVALDASADALALARENAERLGLGPPRVRFAQSDWFSALAGGAVARAESASGNTARAESSPAAEAELPRFDLIVSNPPYLTAEEVAESLPEVSAHEPAGALSPGESGMEAIRKIVAEAPQYLRKADASAGTSGGLLALETGIAQHAELGELFRAAGFARYEFLPDLAQRPRYALAWVS